MSGIDGAANEKLTELSVLERRYDNCLGRHMIEEARCINQRMYEITFDVCRALLAEINENFKIYGALNKTVFRVLKSEIRNEIYRRADRKFDEKIRQLEALQKRMDAYREGGYTLTLNAKKNCKEGS